MADAIDREEQDALWGAPPTKTSVLRRRRLESVWSPPTPLGADEPRAAKRRRPNSPSVFGDDLLEFDDLFEFDVPVVFDRDAFTVTDYSAQLLAEFNAPDAQLRKLQTYMPSFTELICTLGGKSQLAQKHPLPFDGLVVLEEGEEAEGEEKVHRYYWRLTHQDPFRSGGTTSVSKVVERVKQPFPAHVASERSAAKNLRLAETKYRGTADKYGSGALARDELARLESEFGPFCPERLRAAWSAKGKSASELGTALHADIEHYYERGVLPAVRTPQFEQFLDFCSQPQYGRDMVFRVELSMFYAKLGLTGQADVLFKSPNHPNKYVLGDWKRLSDPNKQETLSEAYRLAFPGADRTKVGLYYLQLNLYRFMAQQHGLDIESMFLCIFPADGSKWKLVPVPVMEAETRWLLGRMEQELADRYK